MLEKEIAALNREEEDLQEKRKKLKAAAVNHRDEQSQNKTTEELTKIKERLEEIKEERAKLTAQTSTENNDKIKREIKDIMQAYVNFNENMRAVDAVATHEYRSGWLKKISNRAEQMTDSEKRAMTTVNNDAVVPLITLDIIMGRLTAEGTLREAVQIYNIPRLIEIPIEDLVNDAVWLPEGIDGTIKDDTTRSIKLSHNKLVRFIKMTVELETLSLSAVEAWVVDRMVRKMAIGLEKSVALGTGAGQPLGFIPGITWDASNSKEVTTLTYDDMVNLELLVDDEYIGDAFYIMDRKSLAKVRLLKDESKRPLFDAEVKDGFVGRIAGIPVRRSRYVNGIYLGSWKNVWVGNFIKPIEFATSAEAGFMSVSTVYRAHALFDGKPSTIPGTVARITFA